MSEFEHLGARERQIVEAVFKLEEGSVNDVLDTISDPPSYSAVRAMLNVLVRKGYLDFRKDGNRYLYRPKVAKKTARKIVLKNILDKFFGGRATDAVAALLDVAEDELSEEDYKQLRKLIDNAKNGAK